MTQKRKNIKKKPAAKTARPRKSVPVSKPTPAPEPVASVWQIRWRKALKFGIIPGAIYSLFFTIYTWPWIPHFSNRFFSDGGDGFQNVWNVWWINKAVTELHTTPWHTDFLHYPYGVTLIGQTLNPFNGFVAIPLLKFMSLVQAYNTMVIFSFIVGGLTMYWLCYYFTRRQVASIIGGFLWTFSSYHLAHAVGHMQLVSLEWIPLFIMLWWMLLTKPRYRTAAGASFALLLVLLCDYYYFLYSVVLAVMILAYLWWRKDVPSLKLRQTQRPFIAFILLSAIIILPLPAVLALINARDPLQGSHPARIFSTDILSPFVNGGFWRFGNLTARYWNKVKAGPVEGTVYLTLTVLILQVIALKERAKIHRDVVFWFVVAAIYALFSLGPRVLIAGNTIEHAPLPYGILERVIPPLKLSGVPVRMMVMTTFATAIVAAMVLAKLDLSKRKGKIIMALVSVILIFELWPASLQASPAAHPKYLDALRDLPMSGVLDNGALSEGWQLYGQTITEKPIVLGYISRTPETVVRKDNEFITTVGAGKFDKLCSAYKVRYYTTPVSKPLKGTSFPVLYKDNETIIYDLKNSPNC